MEKTQFFKACKALFFLSTVEEVLMPGMGSVRRGRRFSAEVGRGILHKYCVAYITHSRRSQVGPTVYCFHQAVCAENLTTVSTVMLKSTKRKLLIW